MGAFIFQSNPEVWDVRPTLNEGHTEPWTLKQYKRLIAEGDLVFLWLANKDKSIRGLHGWGIATSEVYDFAPDDPRIDVTYEARFESPITVDEIKAAFAQAKRDSPKITRYAQGTNFVLSREETEILFSLIEERDYKMPAVDTFFPPDAQRSLKDARSAPKVPRESPVQDVEAPESTQEQFTAGTVSSASEAAAPAAPQPEDDAAVSAADAAEDDPLIDPRPDDERSSPEWEEELQVFGDVRVIGTNKSPGDLGVEALVLSADVNGKQLVASGLHSEFVYFRDKIRQTAAADFGIDKPFSDIIVGPINLPEKEPRRIILASAAGEEGITETSIRASIAAIVNVVQDQPIASIAIPILPLTTQELAETHVARIVLDALSGLTPGEALESVFLIVQEAPTDSLLLSPQQEWSDFDNDRVSGRISADADKLGVKDDVSRLSQLIAAQEVKPPLSIGLFGKWGTGKSFIMGMMRDKIEALAGSSSAYVSRVAQIEFNAWHYVDQNLWASLATRIFDGLVEEISGEREPEERISQKRRDLRKEVESNRRLGKQAEAQRDLAAVRRAERQRDLDEAMGDRSRKVDALKWLRLKDTPEFAQALQNAEKILHGLGLGQELSGCEDLTGLLGRLNADRRRVATYWQAAKSLSRRPFGWGLLLVCGVSALVYLLPANIVGFITSKIDLGLGWIATSAASLVGLLGKAVTDVVGGPGRIARVRALLDDFALPVVPRAANEESEDDKSAKTLADEIEKLDVDIATFRQQVQDADRRILETEAELRRIAEGGLVYDMAQQARANASYKKELGIISVVRQDFENLRATLADWQQDQDSQAKAGDKQRPIERIVLYIDDLDRCEPDRVVEVLQAVHLILAFDLFTVVVGVDPRWLERSLKEIYGEQVPADLAGNGSAAPGQLAFSPQNYLEKIFQIPFSISGLESDGFGTLIDDLVTTRSNAEEAERRKQEAAEAERRQQEEAKAKHQAEKEEPPEATVDPEVDVDPQDDSKADDPADSADAEDPNPRQEDIPKISSSDEPDSNGPAEDDEPVAVNFVEDWEEKYMKVLHEFIETPRQAKRFVNIYRLLRVYATETRFQFVGTSTGGPFQAALLLLAINTGFPRASGLILGKLMALTKDEAEQSSWSEFLAGLTDPKAMQVLAAQEGDAVAAELGKVQVLVDKLSSPGNPQAGAGGTLKPVHEHLPDYVTWSQMIARYSFHWHLSASAAD